MIEQNRRPRCKRKVFFMLFTSAMSVIMFAVYRFSLFLDFFFSQIMWTYIIAVAMLILACIFYNRGFLHKGITPEMLPIDWDEKKKQEFIRDAEKRIRRSAWMFSMIVALLATFFFEAFELFVLPLLYGWL